MKKVISIMIAIMINIITITASPFRASADEEKKTSNRFNVVYVLDNSGSMKKTDPNNMRYVAASLFTSLLANDGNYVGTVIFSDDIKLQHPVSEIDSFDSKKKLINEVTNTEIEGWTNIGEALLTAEDMLKKGGNPEIDSVILFLTDGNTEMGTKEETQKSLDDKAAAIQSARDNDIKIYSICLNAAGINSDSLNPQEMKQIADATEGEYIEVTSDDLTEAFQKFYEMIYSTKADEIGGGELDTNGEFKESFDIPYAGVEEVNIIVSSEKKLSEIKLTKPDGTEISGKSIDNIMLTSENYNVLKIIAPEGGKWSLYVNGDPSTKIKISMMFNGSLSISAVVDSPKDTYNIDDKVVLKSVVSTNGKTTSDNEVIKDYKISTVVLDQHGKINEYPTKFVDGSFITEYEIKDYGTYTLYSVIEGNGLSAVSEKTELYVGNTPPTVVEDSITKTVNIWPLIELDCSVDLAEAVTDKEDKNLTFTIDSTSFLDESYELNGTVLSMKDFDISKGSFTIKATDSMGASAIFEVYMISRNIPLYIAIGVFILGLIILISLIIKIYKEHGRYFKGTITVTAVYADGTSQTEYREPRRGRYKLSAFGLKSIKGFNLSKMYFQATGKKYVELRSKKAFQSRNSRKPLKKMKVEQVAVEIFADINSGESMTVQFDPSN